MSTSQVVNYRYNEIQYDISVVYGPTVTVRYRHQLVELFTYYSVFCDCEFLVSMAPKKTGPFRVQLPEAPAERRSVHSNQNKKYKSMWFGLGWCKHMEFFKCVAIHRGEGARERVREKGKERGGGRKAYPGSGNRSTSSPV